VTFGSSLPGGVHVAVALEQVAPVVRQRAPVRADHAPFDRALASFAETYADQNERDYHALADAATSGRVAAELIA
jgi:hypothetical protein